MSIYNYHLPDKHRPTQNTPLHYLDQASITWEKLNRLGYDYLFLDSYFLIQCKLPIHLFQALTIW